MQKGHAVQFLADSIRQTLLYIYYIAASRMYWVNQLSQLCCGCKQRSEINTCQAPLLVKICGFLLSTVPDLW